MIKSYDDWPSLIVLPRRLRPWLNSLTNQKGISMETQQSPQPARSRAVFSPEDFGLIRTAIAHYLREVQDQPESVKYANLYHRLGRVG
ncbi:MAG TPA: hypothetical protein VF475_04160 [Sphingobium sp.]